MYRLSMGRRVKPTKDVTNPLHPNRNRPTNMIIEANENSQSASNGYKSNIVEFYYFY